MNNEYIFDNELSFSQSVVGEKKLVVCYDAERKSVQKLFIGNNLPEDIDHTCLILQHG
jgi:hypothetical protein